MKVNQLLEMRDEKDDIIDNHAKVTPLTEEFLKFIQDKLKSVGFKRTSNTKQSALYHWTFERGDRQIEISGWHGTGTKGTSRHYGDGKTVFSLYDTQPEKGFKPERSYSKTHNVMVECSSLGSWQEHNAALDKMKKYIAAVK